MSEPIKLWKGAPKYIREASPEKQAEWLEKRRAYAAKWSRDQKTKETHAQRHKRLKKRRDYKRRVAATQQREIRRYGLKYTDHWTNDMWSEWDKMRNDGTSRRDAHRWRMANDEWFAFITRKRNNVFMRRYNKENPHKAREKWAKLKRELKQNPEMRNRYSAKQRESHLRKLEREPDLYRRQYQKHKEKMASDATYKQRHRESRAKLYASDSYKKWAREYQADPEVRRRIRDSSKRRYWENIEASRALRRKQAAKARSKKREGKNALAFFQAMNAAAEITKATS